MERRTKRIASAVLGLALASGAGIAAHECCWRTEEPAQIVGDNAATDKGWDVLPLVTVGEQDGSGNDVNLAELGFSPPGLLDGIGAFRWNRHTVRAFVNSELGATAGYKYKLANGLELTGARVNWFDIDRKSRKVCGAGLAYDRVFDRAGNEVTSATQINEGLSTTQGFDRFCSGGGVEDGEKGFRDDIYFCGEESSGGQQCALDISRDDLYVVPMAGRAAFENICPMENLRSDKVLFLIGDDTTASAPLYLYVGQKDGAPSSGYTPPKFLKRNGLGLGQLYVWVSDDGDDNPTTFKGTGASRKGKFKKITHFDASKAGTSGWDSLGFASQATQYAAADALDSFTFTRPEDLSANPCDGTQAVFVSTGASSFGGVDTWGTVYVLDIDDKDLDKQLDKKLSDISEIKAKLTIVYDCDDTGGGQFSQPNLGLRSPDNLDWADDGNVYIQEDRAVSASAFGSNEASVWCLDPCSGKIARILQIDPSAVPNGQTNSAPTDVGNWESSGVLDVTKLFKTKKGETLLILDVQGHSLTGGLITSKTLAEGGQLVLASKFNKKSKDWDNDCDDDWDDKHDRKHKDKDCD